MEVLQCSPSLKQLDTPNTFQRRKLFPAEQAMQILQKFRFQGKKPTLYPLPGKRKKEKKSLISF